MSVRTAHKDDLDWFITFTCYEWMQLFEITNSYDLVYNWFDHLKKNKKADILAFVIMPNHSHAIIHLNDFKTDLNKLIANGKRFMAYELIDRLQLAAAQGHQLITSDQNLVDPAQTLAQLGEGVNESDRRKGQKHRAFETSFDAKCIYTLEFFNQKLNYIHHNPVRGKWNLVDDYRDYEHSSASFYELGVEKRYRPCDYRDIWQPSYNADTHAKSVRRRSF